MDIVRVAGFVLGEFMGFENVFEAAYSQIMITYLLTSKIDL